jgi:hypothetical protein
LQQRERLDGAVKVRQTEVDVSLAHFANNHGVAIQYV